MGRPRLSLSDWQCDALEEFMEEGDMRVQDVAHRVLDLFLMAAFGDHAARQRLEALLAPGYRPLRREDGPKEGVPISAR